MSTSLADIVAWVDGLSPVAENLVIGIAAGLIVSLILSIRSFAVTLAGANLLKSRTQFSWFSKTWLCEWEPESLNKPEWTKEKLVIRRFFNKLIIHNHENDCEYRYRGQATLARGERLDGKYLLGNWFDLKEGATAAGVFMLTIEHRGNFLFGYIVGPNDEGPILYGKYVVGRTPADILDAKRLLAYSDVLPP
ncbi:MAG TPA: hypothetical protein VF625_12370 [Longimicrobium sp.]|jgi:hypothetical protein